MCIFHSTKNHSGWKTIAIYTSAIALGIIAGLYQVPGLTQAGVAIAEIFIKIFRCLSLPLISLSLLVTIIGYQTKSGLGSLGKRVLAYTLGTTLVAASIAWGLYIWISPQITASTNIITTAVAPQISYWDHVKTLIPSNILEPFIEHQVMAALLSTLIAAYAIRQIKDHEQQTTVVRFFQGMHSIFMTLAHAVVKAIPLALFGFITVGVEQLSGDMPLASLAEYLFIVVAANLIQGLIVLPLWLKRHGLAPTRVARAMSPALALAFLCKSSAGTLPVTLECAQQRLGIRASIAQFVLPICTTINMNGCAAFIFTTVVFVSQSNGVAISPLGMGIWVLIATLAAVGNAGRADGLLFLERKPVGKHASPTGTTRSDPSDIQHYRHDRNIPKRMVRLLHSCCGRSS